MEKIKVSTIWNASVLVYNNWDLISAAIDDSANAAVFYEQFDWNDQQKTRRAMTGLINLPVFTLAVRKTVTDFDDQMLNKARWFISNADVFDLSWKVAHSNLTVVELAKILAGGTWKKIINTLPFAMAEEEQEEPEIGILTVIGIISVSVHLLRFIQERRQQRGK
jgi:hypothetical protein